MRRPQYFATILVGKSVLLREGIAKILQASSFRILGSVSSTDDLPSIKLQHQQTLLLIIHTGDDFESAVEQIEFFREQHPSARIAIVADHYRLSELVSAFRAGANGYFVDAITCDAFIKSIEVVMMGETVFPPDFLSFVRDPASDFLGKSERREQNNRPILFSTKDDSTAPQLSLREKAILRYLVEGDTNKSIARKIDIAESTVKVHVKAILRKIRVQNRTQAAIWAINNGSLTRPVSGSSPCPIPDVSKRPPDPIGATSEVRQIDAPTPVGVVNHEANHVEVTRIDRLIRKTIN